ncbi:hypothetical protein ACFFRR_006021 [Megaselia abdita]
MESDSGEKIPLLSGFIINIPKEKTEKKKLSTLTYEEIIVYETDPFWMSFRQIFFYSFWVVIASLVISASFIAHNQSGRCLVINSTSLASPVPPVELLAIVSNIGNQIRPTNMSAFIDDFILSNNLGSGNVTRN